MATRPTVTIANGDGTPSGHTHPLPAVFKSPIRPDIVQYDYCCCFVENIWLIEKQKCSLWYGKK